MISYDMVYGYLIKEKKTNFMDERRVSQDGERWNTRGEEENEEKKTDKRNEIRQRGNHDRNE
jgi:hypothetical protein